MSRQGVLSAVREALAAQHGDGRDTRLPYPTGSDPRTHPKASTDELCAEFLEEFDRLATYEDERFGAAWRVDSMDEAQDRIHALLTREDMRAVASTPSALVDDVLTPELRELVQYSVVDSRDKAGTALSGCDLGITDCVCLAAHTGSVLVSTGDAGSRAVSLLPPAHLVLATLDQLVPDIPEAIDRIVAADDFPTMPAAYTFVTGASRTSDIEKVLVVPAHGPREVFVLLLPPPA